MSTRYEWSWDDWRTASDSHLGHLAEQKGKFAWPSFLIKIALLMAVVTLGRLLLPRKMPAGSKWLVILATAAIVYYAVVYLSVFANIIRWAKYRKHVRSTADQSRSVEWGYDQERLWVHSDLTEAAYRWALFKTIVEAPRCFLFYRGEELLLWVPWKGFASAESIRRFADLAKTKVPNYVVLGECQFPAKPEPTGLQEL